MIDHRYPKSEYDLIIVGAGCAGLACAIEAADLGREVAVLEKMARPAGNILFAGGAVCAAGTRFQQAQGISEEVEPFYRDLLTVSQQRGDPALLRVYAEKSAEAIHWLSDTVGVQWATITERLPPVNCRVHQVNGPLRPGGAQLSRDLLTAATKRAVPLFSKVAIRELLSDAGGVITGVRITFGGEVMEVRARGGVVLATGGFHANREMVRTYIGVWAARMPFRGSKVNTGENITLSEPFGPKLVNMDQFHGGPIHGPTRANPSSAVNYGICVTPEGKRYVDEGLTYVRVGRETARKSQNNEAFIILDKEARQNPIVNDRFERYGRARAPVYEDNDIRGLARKAGITAETLAKTVKEFNKAVRVRRTGHLIPPNTLDCPNPIDTSPYYALPFRGGMTATFGGPLINIKAQVIKRDDKIIPGLYAVGNAAGGLFYGDYIIGSQFGAAIVFGRIAAADACTRLK